MEDIFQNLRAAQVVRRGRKEKAVVVNLDREDVVDVVKDNAGGQTGEVGVGKTVPGDLPGKVLDLEMGKSGGEYSGRAFKVTKPLTATPGRPKTSSTRSERSPHMHGEWSQHGDNHK
jgi:hypothetical protein